MPTAQASHANRVPGLLIVDPDPRVRGELARGLEGAGWHVWVAADGRGAIDTYRRNRRDIDVALIDLQLPGLQGAQILTELADLDPNLVRCAMSANVSPYAASAFRRMSDTPLFTKPLDPDLLACTLHEMLEPVHGR
jgi:CheY-like chemotaxis protein